MYFGLKNQSPKKAVNKLLVHQMKEKRPQIMKGEDVDSDPTHEPQT